MIKTFFARKIKMIGKYNPTGVYVGSTILAVPQTTVKDLRTKEKNGYAAVRLEIKGKKEKNKSVLKEIRTNEVIDPGTQINFEEMVKVGDNVKVTSISKGRGFAGVVKRHNFKGGPRTHGQSDRERAPGSSGSTTTPGRVFKGKRRAGHMGVEKVSIKGLKVMEIDIEKRTLTVGGGVPGFNGSKELVTITTK